MIWLWELWTWILDKRATKARTRYLRLIEARDKAEDKAANLWTWKQVKRGQADVLFPVQDKPEDITVLPAETQGNTAAWLETCDSTTKQAEFVRKLIANTPEATLDEAVSLWTSLGNTEANRKSLQVTLNRARKQNA